MSLLTTIPGGTVTVRLAVKRVRDGAAGDPSALIVTVQDATRTAVATYSWPGAVEVVHDATGDFHVDIAVPIDAVSGVWAVRWHGTGGLAGAGEVRFGVRPSAMAVVT